MLLKKIMPTQNFYRKGREFWKMIVEQEEDGGGEGERGGHESESC
jgi:hypothetical protein